MRMASSQGDRGGLREHIISVVNSRKSTIVHLTHNDLDAVGADAIHRMKYGEVTSIFSSVGKFPDILAAISGIAGDGSILSISDLGFRKGIESLLITARENGWKIEWRDHHRWNDDEIRVSETLCDLLHVDTGTCACGICAQDLAPEDPSALEVARVVCDYDLWKHEDPRSAVLGLVLQRRKNRDYVRDCLVRGIFTDDFIRQEYEEIRDEMESMIGKSIRKAKIYGKKYRIAFAPLYGYPSETAGRMREVLGTDIEVLVSPRGRFSLRSVPPISHILARGFHGGGHPNAAGGSFDFTFWDRLFFRLLGRSSHFDRFVDVCEST